jgi:chromosome segregation ATPase
VRSNEISELLSSLLATTVIADNAREAESILRNNPAVTVVTRDGDVITAQRARGGSASSNSLIEIKALVDDLAAKLEDLNHKCDRLKFEISSAETHVQEKQLATTNQMKVEESTEKKAQREFENSMRTQSQKMDMERLALDRQRYLDQQKANQNKLSSENTKLNTETVGKISNLQTVTQSINEITNSMERLLSNPFDLQAFQDYKYSVALASENLGRVQSGGAITADELVTFKNLIAPSALAILDKGEGYKRNIKKLETAINNKIQNFAQGGVSKQSTPTSGIMFKTVGTTKMQSTDGKNWSVVK